MPPAFCASATSALADPMISAQMAESAAPPALIGRPLLLWLPVTGPIGRRSAPSWVLFVQPPVFHAPAVVLAVDHQGDAFELRLPTGRGAQVIDDRPAKPLLQQEVGVLHQLLALY